MSQPHLSEQEIIRREKLQAMQSAGVDAFPAALYPVTHYSVDIKEGFTEETSANLCSCLCGWTYHEYQR
jgi:lysyl-tRNA synthetase class 2